MDAQLFLHWLERHCDQVWPSFYEALKGDFEQLSIEELVAYDVLESDEHLLVLVHQLEGPDPPVALSLQPVDVLSTHHDVQIFELLPLFYYAGDFALLD